LEKKSLRELVLDYTQNLFERGYDFTIKYNRKKARQGFIDAYKLDPKKGADTWNHVFPVFLRKNKLKKEEYLETRFRRPLFSDLKATITAKPQGPIVEKHPVEIINEELKQKESEIQPQTEQIQVKNEHIEAEAIESALGGLWALIKLKYPELDQLTKEEKESLARMWLPAFRKYLNEYWTYLGMPLLATIGILANKIKKARDKKKEKDTKEE